MTSSHFYDQLRCPKSSEHLNSEHDNDWILWPAYLPPEAWNPFPPSSPL